MSCTKAAFHFDRCLCFYLWVLYGTVIEFYWIVYNEIFFYYNTTSQITFRWNRFIIYKIFRLNRIKAMFNIVTKIRKSSPSASHNIFQIFSLKIYIEFLKSAPWRLKVKEGEVEVFIEKGSHWQVLISEYCNGSMYRYRALSLVTVASNRSEK